MAKSALGKKYKGGEVIVREGEVGNCMYVIMEGDVEVVTIRNGEIHRLAQLGRGDFFGEMSIFEKEVRSATVRALGDVRLLTVDKRTFLRRIQEDPTLAFRIVKEMSARVARLNKEMVALRG
jgi:CRP-like cAMP-binding protein